MARSADAGAPPASLLLAGHPLPTAARRSQGALECAAGVNREEKEFLVGIGHRRCSVPRSNFVRGPT